MRVVGVKDAAVGMRVVVAAPVVVLVRVRVVEAAVVTVVPFGAASIIVPGVGALGGGGDDAGAGDGQCRHAGAGFASALQKAAAGDRNAVRSRLLLVPNPFPPHTILIAL